MGSRTIGTLASEAGVNVETVCYYERRGLLRQPPRTTGGYRQYTEHDLERLLLIARAKHLGFTLSEIAELIGPADGRSTSSVRQLALAKMTDLRQRQQEMAATQARLALLMVACADPTNPDCTALRVTS
jgi:DNA-binding transcriptional MerR regulator